MNNRTNIELIPYQYLSCVPVVDGEIHPEGVTFKLLRQNVNINNDSYFGAVHAD